MGRCVGVQSVIFWFADFRSLIFQVSLPNILAGSGVYLPTRLPLRIASALALIRGLDHRHRGRGRGLLC